MGKSCLDCLYADYTLISFIMTLDVMKCEHPNSPFNNEIVDENTICKFFTDEKEYFFNKDRLEKITKLKDKFK